VALAEGDGLAPNGDGLAAIITTIVTLITLLLTHLLAGSLGLGLALGHGLGLLLAHLLGGLNGHFLAHVLAGLKAALAQGHGHTLALGLELAALAKHPDAAALLLANLLGGNGGHILALLIWDLDILALFDLLVLAYVLANLLAVTTAAPAALADNNGITLRGKNSLGEDRQCQNGTADDDR